MAAGTPTLDVRIDALAAGDVLRARYYVGTGQVGPTRAASRAELLALGIAPLLQGDVQALRAELAAHGPGAVLGHHLCTWLFGGEDEQRALFGSVFAGDAVATTGAVHLVLHTDDADVAGVPWCLLAWKGIPLVSVGWSMQLATSPPASVHLGGGARVLVVAPGPVGGPDIGTTSHVAQVQTEIQMVLDEAAYVAVASTPEELRTALGDVGGAAWDIVYFYGHGSDDPSRPGLMFPGKRVSADELAQWMELRPAKLLLLQCCLAGAHGWLSAASRLRGCAAVVVGHATRIPALEARQRSLAMFREVLQGKHPALAACRPLPSSADGFGWMTPVVFSSVAPTAWSGGATAVIPPRPPSKSLALKLDRDAQRNALATDARLHLLGADGSSNALACVVTGDPDNGVELMGRIAEDILARTCGPTRRFSVSTPQDPSRPEAWAEALEEALGVPAGLGVRVALLRRLAQDGLSDAPAPLVVLDFGAHAVPPLRVSAWVELCRRWSHSLDPADRARLVCIYGLVISGAQHDALEQAWIQDQTAALAPERLRPCLLERLEDVERKHLVALLTSEGAAVSLARERVHEAANAVLERLGRPPEHATVAYEPVAVWLERALASSWAAALGIGGESGAAASTISGLF